VGRSGTLVTTQKLNYRGAGDVLTRMRSLPSRAFGSCILLFLASSLHAQDGCGVEVKLLLSPAETQTAVSALGFEKKATGRVYFFDTSTLDLQSQGAIVRLRQGVDRDLTVKLRPRSGRKLPVPSPMGEGFKCEIDLNGGNASPSYSVLSKSAATRIPETGTDILALLNASQVDLLKKADISVDWTGVKRIADIQSTDWQTKAQPHFGKLTLELWEWSGGRVLELSTKVGPDAGPSMYKQLQRLANAKGLALNPTQQAKTAMVLEMLTKTTLH
jgi:hypothetical protein